MCEKLKGFLQYALSARTLLNIIHIFCMDYYVDVISDRNSYYALYDHETRNRQVAPVIYSAVHKSFGALHLHKLLLSRPRPNWT